jgi:hypothetical protein
MTEGKEYSKKIRKEKKELRKGNKKKKNIK